MKNFQIDYEWLKSSDAASWAGVLVAAIAVFLAYRTFRVSKRSSQAADTATEASVKQVELTQETFATDRRSILKVGIPTVTFSHHSDTSSHWMKIEVPIQNIGRVDCEVVQIRCNSGFRGDRGSDESESANYGSFSLLQGDSPQTIEILNRQIPTYNLAFENNEITGTLIIKIRFKDRFSYRERFIHYIAECELKESSAKLIRIDASRIAGEVQLDESSSKSNLSIKEQFNL